MCLAPFITYPITAYVFTNTGYYGEQPGVGSSTSGPYPYYSNRQGQENDFGRFAASPPEAPKPYTNSRDYEQQLRDYYALITRPPYYYGPPIAYDIFTPKNTIIPSKPVNPVKPAVQRKPVEKVFKPVQKLLPFRVEEDRPKTTTKKPEEEFVVDSDAESRENAKNGASGFGDYEDQVLGKGSPKSLKAPISKPAKPFLPSRAGQTVDGTHYAADREKPGPSRKTEFAMTEFIPIGHDTSPRQRLRIGVHRKRFRGWTVEGDA
ncbi:unnamed protein product, partial [Mesorhabditis spiculigera]